MHTVEMLEQALALVKQLGYSVRYESLEGHSGACELKGQKILFLDLGLSPSEQLEYVLEALKEALVANPDLPNGIQELLASQG